MSTSRLGRRAALAHLGLVLFASSTDAIGMIDWPRMQWNPETIATCAAWLEPYGLNNTQCESFRSGSGFSPEQFHEFNPSVGLNCEGWEEFQSYCVADDIRQDLFWQTAADPIWTSVRPYATATPVVTATVTGAAGAFGTGTGVMVDATPVPSPKIWKPLGCVPAKKGEDVLAKQIENIPGQLMTTQLCRAKCWADMAGKEAFLMGLRNGNECWCGKKLLAEYGPQTYSGDGCGKVCEGDKKQYCGGEEHMEVAEAIVVYGTGLAWGMKPQSSIVVASAGAAAVPTGSANAGGSAANGQQSVATGGRGILNMALTMMMCMSAAAMGIL